jgi:hypothetical protein
VTQSAAVRPPANEHHPYYGKYIALVPESDGIAALENQLADMTPLLEGLSEAQGSLRYAPGKWSVKQVVQHVLDAERVFAYRALRFARADRTPVPGFDENTYAETAGADGRTLRSLADELALVRRANVEMFRGLEPVAWTRLGIANENEVSVRALAFIIAGHARHHVGLLRERYLAARP